MLWTGMYSTCQTEIKVLQRCMWYQTGIYKNLQGQPWFAVTYNYIIWAVLTNSKLMMIQVLPSRIHEWSLTPSVAEQRNRAELEEVRKKQYICRKEIEELEAKRRVSL